MIAGNALDLRGAAGRDAARAQVFESVPEGLYLGLLDPTSPASAGTTLAANACLRSILGYEPTRDEQAVLLFHPSHFTDAPARDAVLARLFADGRVSDYLLKLRQIDGSSVWVELTARVTGPPGGLPTVVALVRDVSARRAQEDRARGLYQQLAHSEQLAAIDRTLADVAHELGNPLSTIVGWAERLTPRPLDEVARKGIAEILSAAERASRIIRTALHATGPRPSTRSLVDVNAVVRDTIALRQYEQQAANVGTTVELDDDVPPVFADPHQIQQVLLNVVINAEQAMASAHGRGSLTVRTRPEISRGMVIVEVSDDGPGVPESARSRIFDPFFTTKQSDSGTGLGLAVAQALTREHGGSIRLAERTGASGATFIIELPARAARPSESD